MSHFIVGRDKAHKWISAMWYDPYGFIYPTCSPITPFMSCPDNNFIGLEYWAREKNTRKRTFSQYDLLAHSLRGSSASMLKWKWNGKKKWNGRWWSHGLVQDLWFCHNGNCTLGWLWITVQTCCDAKSITWTSCLGAHLSIQKCCYGCLLACILHLFTN